MPLEIKYIDDGVGVEFISSGTLTGAEIIEANRQVYENENFHKQRYQLIDRTACEKYQVSSEELRKIAIQDEEAAKSNPNILMALVAKSPLEFGMSRMYQVFLSDSGFQTAIFPDRESGMEWIQGELDKQQNTSLQDTNQLNSRR